jgi:hypothetical protein
LYKRNSQNIVPDDTPNKFLWIAPTQRDNAQTGLTDGVKLDDENCIGPNCLYGNYHFVWGFNAGCVAKWHTLQKNDLIIFGNAKQGFTILGEVKHKFIWLPGKSDKVFSYASPSGKAWLYGYTLQILSRNLNITSKEQSDLCGGIKYQTQTRLTYSARMWDRLEMIFGYSLK